MVRRLVSMSWVALLLAAAMAAAWALGGGLTNAALNNSLLLSGSPSHELGGARVCYYAPGHEMAPPSATEIAEARASWAWAEAKTCRYDAAQGFGPMLSAADIAEARAGMAAWPAHACRFDATQDFRMFPDAQAFAETRMALARVGGGEGLLGALWAVWGAIGTASIGHGLLVGSLGIFNPALARIGWWLMAPEAALAAIGWGAAAAGFAGLAALPRYVRRGGTRPWTAPAAATAGSAARPWLTPKRLVAVGGGWLVTVGVLAAAYPQISKLMPHNPGVTVDGSVSAPRGAAPSAGAQTTDASTGGATLDNSSPESGSAAAVLPLAPASGDAQPSEAGAEAGGADTTPSGGAPVLSGFGTAGMRGGGAAGSNAAAASGSAATETVANGGAGPALPTIPASGFTAGGVPYLPPASAAAVASASTLPSVTPSAALPLPLPTLAPTPVRTAAAEVGLPTSLSAVTNEARSGIAERPIVDTAYPLPSSADAVLPATDVVDSGNGGGSAGGSGSSDASVDPDPVVTRPANPGAVAPDADPAAVPEPGMLGLFAFGAAALAWARRRRN